MFKLCFRVLGVDVSKGRVGPTLNLPKQCLRRVELRELARSESRRARVLTVAEVATLEDIMENDKMKRSQCLIALRQVVFFSAYAAGIDGVMRIERTSSSKISLKMQADFQGTYGSELDAARLRDG